MRNLLLFYSFIPLLLFSQNSDGYFEQSKDAFYFEKMSYWKEDIYKNSGSKFEINIDNDSIFAFSAIGSFFKETFQISLGKEKKVKKIERFVNVHNGKLEDFFPHKYPVNVSKVFKKLGNPDVIKSNLPYLNSGYFLDSKGSIFLKHFKWNEIVLGGSTKSDLEIATLQSEKAIKNKKGKIKKYEKNFMLMFQIQL